MSLVIRRAVRIASMPPRRIRAAGLVACLITATLTFGETPAALAADTEAPVWASVSVSPTSVDTSAGTATVTVTARITDDEVGLHEAFGGEGKLTFGLASTTQTASVTFRAAHRISGTNKDGVYQSTLTLPRYAGRGTWSIISSRLGDGDAHARATSNAAESAAAGLTATFDQTGRGDGTAPRVTAVTLDPTTVDTSADRRVVTMRVHVTDDLSGVDPTGPGLDAIMVEVAGPPGTQLQRFFFSFATRISGTDRDGVWETTVMMGRYSGTGTWRVGSVSASDAVGNSRTVQEADVAAAGLDATFTQTGAGDVTPPTLSEVSLSPAEVNPALSYQYVTVRGRITDDLSGVRGDSEEGYARISFQSDAAATMQTGVVFTAAQRVSGTHTDGIYQTLMWVPLSWKGLFTVTRVTTTDYKGNYRITNGSELGPLSVRAVDTVLVPSAPKKVRVTANNGSLTASWEPPTNDGGGARTGYQVTASGGVSGMLGCDGMSGEMPVTGQTNSCDVTVTAGPSATSATITGLTDGRTYAVRVTASNSAGWGPPSEPVSATPGTPSAPPGVPSGVTATAGNDSATVTWSAPNNNGAAVTSYTVTAFAHSAVAQTVVVDAPATSVVVTGLINGTAYKFSVAATNAAGTGATSGKTAEVKPKAPTSTTTSTTTTSTTTTSTTTTSTTTTSTTTSTTAPKPTTTTTTSTTTKTTVPPVNVGTANARSGYWMVSAEGRVYAFGEALHHGEPRAQLGNGAAADLEPTKSNNGYWILDDAGRIFPYGDARWFGNADPTRLVAGERATSLSRTVSGNGYWVFTNRGRVLTFGDAVSYGDVSAVPLNGPVLDSIVTPSGKGYYMVASDGGIFAFGDAKFHGSMGGAKLNAAVQSLVPDGDGEGYWLVASDGGIFAFKAPFRGSLGAQRLNRPVSGMVPFGDGYLMVGEDGGIFNFSDRPFLGSLGATPPARPVVAVAVLEA